MAVIVSPLELLLDVENPRFVILAHREQADIRKYLLAYEDVCQLAIAINEYGSLLPGERIVVLQKEEQYIVVEGNRRTCALQLLLYYEIGFFCSPRSTANKPIIESNTKTRNNLEGESVRSQLRR